MVKIKKSLIYENESKNFKVYEYPFIVEKVDEFGVKETKTYNLVELVKTKKVWSNEINNYYDKKSFITIGLDDFKDLILKSS